MYNFAFLLKTYERDFLYARRLLNSFEKYNRDKIHCYVVVPEESEKKLIDSLDETTKKNLSFIIEEEFDGLVKESINGINEGYINQEIIKLSFWEKGLCKNYCCLDSDAEFIRDFYIDDFMYDDDIPYTVLIEDKDLKADPYYYHSFWKDREKALQKIQQELEYKPRKLLTCHGFQNFSSVVLNDFKNNFMEIKGFSYVDIMKISPYEFTWYNIWLQKSKVIEIYPCEPIFKTFHMKHQLSNSWASGVTIDDIARSYVGIVINSNYLDGKMIQYMDSFEIRKGWFQVIKRMIRYYIFSFIKKDNK